MRTGLLARKLGMTHLYDKDGAQVPITLLRVDGCRVVGSRTQEKDGYCAVQLGAGARKPKRTNKALKGQFAKAGLQDANQRVVEFRVGDAHLLTVGDKLMPTHFADGQFVDATANSIGKGFAGAMKRHNFGGLRASHGVSISHRSHGSTGQRQDPGKVFKGKKMAGHMGDRRVTIQNLQVVQVDDADGLIWLKGAVPGARGSWVLLRDAVKRPPAAQPAGESKDDAKEKEPVKEAGKESAKEGGEEAGKDKAAAEKSADEQSAESKEAAKQAADDKSAASEQPAASEKSAKDKDKA